MSLKSLLKKILKHQKPVKEMRFIRDVSEIKEDQDNIVWVLLKL